MLVTVAVGIAVGTGVCVGVAVGVGIDVAVWVDVGVGVSGGTAVGVSSARAIGAGVAVGGGVSSPHEISRVPTAPAIRNVPNACGLESKRSIRSQIVSRIVEIVVATRWPVKPTLPFIGHPQFDTPVAGVLR